MKQRYLLAVGVGALGLLGACGSPGGVVAYDAATAQVKADSLTRSFDTWYSYAYYRVRLGRPFTGVNAAGQLLARQAFLEQLATGRFIALKVDAPGNAAARVYQLWPLTAKDESISSTSRQQAATELAHYRLEGKRLPAFAFRDLRGRQYTPASTRGKVLVLKTWYTSCVACVDEFPLVNKLVDQYQGRPDVEFISLALDDSTRLRQFLARREFRYAVVPGCRPYVLDSLQSNGFPTHVVVGRDGKVVKVCDRLDDLTLALARVVPPALPRAAR